MPNAEHATGSRPMYTPEQRRRRDASPWTIVQGVLAPLQLLAFLVSLWLVLQFLQTGAGGTTATISIFVDRKSTRLNSSHIPLSRMPSSA